MIKLVGSVMIILAGGFAGIIMALDYMRRPRELRAVQAALQMLETEITYTATPLGEALERVASRSDSGLQLLFLTAASGLRSMSGITAGEAWDTALSKYYPGSSLNENDLQILKNLGNALGVSDRQDQSKHFRLAFEQLKLETARAEAEAAKNVKMWNCLGFCGSMALVLLIY